MNHSPEHAAASITERAAAASFLLLVAALPWSVAPISIGVVLCGALTLAAWWRPGGARWVRTPIDVPALAWLAALALASLFALDPSGSWPNVRKGLLLALVPVAAYHAREETGARRAMAWLLVSAAAATIYALIRFAQDGGAFPARVRGLVGHPLTYGGQAMLLASVATAVVFRVRGRGWRLGAGALLLLLAPALLGSYTRSAWMGTLVVLTVIVARFRARLLPLLGMAALAVLLLLPPGYRSRAASAFDTKSVWNVERVKLWKAGAGIVRDHPVTGVGLQDLRTTIDRYRTEKANEVHGHLHNVWLQVAATMGVVGLATMIALWIGLFRTAAAPPSPSTPFGRAVRDAGVAALAGFLVAGLFEWNLGDEELVNFLATLVGAAFAARGWRET